jgi:ATP-dependent DNA ligase
MSKSFGSIQMASRSSIAGSMTRRAIALAFDLLMHNGEDVRRRPFAERKAVLRKVLQRTRRGIPAALFYFPQFKSTDAAPTR